MLILRKFGDTSSIEHTPWKWTQRMIEG